MAFIRGYKKNAACERGRERRCRCSTVCGASCGCAASVGEYANRCYPNARLSMVERGTLKTLEGVLLGAAGEHFVGGGLAGHGALDGELSRLVVVFVNLLVIGGGGVNEHTADDAEVFAFTLRDDAIGDAVSNGLGDGGLGGAKHLDGLAHALDRDLGDHDGRWLHGQVGGDHGEEVGVTFALTGEGVGERVADGAILAADEEVDMCDFVAFTDKAFADVHGHGSFSRMHWEGGLFATFKGLEM